MAENHTKTKAVGCSTKHNIVMSRRTHHKHDTAPVSLYNPHTITLCSVSDHENGGQKKPEKRWSDRVPVLTQGGACLAKGGGGRALHHCVPACKNDHKVWVQHIECIEGAFPQAQCRNVSAARG